MPTPRLDKNRCHRLYRNHFAVEFHEPFTLEDQINLRQLLVIVRARIELDVDDVDGKGEGCEACGCA